MYKSKVKNTHNLSKYIVYTKDLNPNNPFHARILENFRFIYCFIYQIIKKPIIANVNPPYLNWLSLTSFNFLSIFFIFDGNMAYKIPSINKKRPNAMISSFINFRCY